MRCGGERPTESGPSDRARDGREDTKRRPPPLLRGKEAIVVSPFEAATTSCRLRSHVDAADHVEGSAGHVFVLDAEADGLGDVLGLAEAAHGDRLEDLLLHLLGYRADHVRLYKARANGVDGDTVPREFQCGRLGVPEQASLSRRVVSLAQVSRFADEGAHVDDRAVVLLHHVWQRRVHRVEATIQVQLHDLVPALHVELVQRGVGVYAGVVDQDINPAELLYRLVYELLRVLGVRDVSLDRHRFSPASDLVDLLGHLFGRTLAAGVVDHDLGARTTQIFAYRGPYAPASARNAPNRPLQVQNGLPFRRVSSEPGESIAVPGPDQTMCTTHPNSATAYDPPREPKITLPLSLASPNCETGALQSQK